MIRRKGLKIVVIVAIFVILILGAIVGSMIYNGKLEIGFDKNNEFEIVINDNTEMDTYDQIIEATKTTYPTDIFVYGGECNFRENAQYISIDSITEENIRSNKDYKVIVINDIYDEVDLNEEEFEILYKYVIDGTYALFYLGDKHIDKFVEKEIARDDFREGSLGFGIRHSGTTLIQSSGLWDLEAKKYYEEGNEELLGENIYLFIRKVIREG